MSAAEKVLTFQTIPDFLPLVDPNSPDYHCRYKGFWGGRSSGKSTQLVRAALWRGTQKPMRFLCTREYQNSFDDSVLALIEDQVKVLGYESFYTVQKNTVFGANGTKFIFKGLQGKNATRSKEGIDICLIEEAQSISENSWTDLIPTIRKEGSEIWLVWNPEEDSDPTQRFINNPPPDSYICEVNYDKNPWFSKVSRKEMEYDKARDFGLYEHIWLGKTLKRTEALVFKHWRTDASIEPKENEIMYFGSDFGFSNHPTTLVRMWIDDDKRELYIDHEAYGIGVEIDHTGELYDKVPGARKWKIVADCARPETISYLKRQGYRIERCKKGKDSIEEGVRFIQSYSVVIHPRCKHTIAEFGSYAWKIDPKTDEILPILKDDHNHIIDAVRYALEAVRRRVRIHIG